MSQITARLPDDTVRALDKAASELYLEEYADLSAAVDALRDPSDTILDWEEARAALLSSDQE